jgi:hypothetical protein
VVSGGIIGNSTIVSGTVVAGGNTGGCVVVGAATVVEVVDVVDVVLVVVGAAVVDVVVAGIVVLVVQGMVVLVVVDVDGVVVVVSCVTSIPSSSELQPALSIFSRSSRFCNWASVGFRPYCSAKKFRKSLTVTSVIWPL